MHTNSVFDVPYMQIDQKKIQIRPSLALLGFENFRLVKKWSQDHLFVVTRFLSILSKFSENSTGHVFHLFKLIFSVVTSFVLLSKGKYQKNKKKRSKFPKKQRQPKKIEKERGKRGTISRAHREHHLSYVYMCWFPPCFKSYSYRSHHLIHLILGTWVGQQLRQVPGILIQLCYSIVNIVFPCYYIVPVQAPLSSNQVQVRLATVTLKLQWYHSHRLIAPPVALVRTLVRPW